MRVRGRHLLAAAVVLAIGAFAWRAVAARPTGGGGTLTIGAPREVRAPAGVRVRVEVLNATKTRGLARRATFLLRDRGFDVLGTGTTTPVRDSTLVLSRSGHDEWARLVADALGGARVEARPDSSRYLDVTVLLGGAWPAPAEPLYP